MKKRVSNMEMTRTYSKMLMRNRAIMYRTQDIHPTITMDSVCECEEMVARNDHRLTIMGFHAMHLDNERLFREIKNEEVCKIF